MVNKKMAFLFCMMTWILSGVGLYFYKDCFITKETLTMLLELICVFIYNFLITRYIKSKKIMYSCLIFGFLFEVYIHEMLFPILVVCIYFVFIFLIGKMIAIFLGYPYNYWFDFFLGVATILVVECVLSMLGIGSNYVFAVAIFFMGIFSAIYLFIITKQQCNYHLELSFFNYNSIAIATVITVFVLLIGRCNLAIDYDGLWYGLRSEYLLNSGAGIYDRILETSNVNTYPKGYELLTLPLVIFPSYAFRLSFNIMIGVLIIKASYDTIWKINGKTPFIIIALFSTIPGVMSMCTTMKQDSITLLLQILMILFSLKLINESRFMYIWMIMGLFLLSINMKTTSLVFSSGLLFVDIIFTCINFKKIKYELKGIGITLLAIVCTFLLCFRTYLLCGYPYTSLMVPIFEKLGFSQKQPYILSEPTSTIPIKDILAGEGIVTSIKKLVCAFVVPKEFDGIITSHIRMTWGTSLIFCIFVFVIYYMIRNISKIRNDIEKKYCLYVYFITLFFSGYSVSTLIKNDGNYYMLLYFVSLLIMACCVDFKVVNTNKLKLFIAPIIFSNIFIFSVTGWAGQGAFSNISLINKGYFNHMEDYKKYMLETGKEDIYNYFEQKGRDHILIFGELECNRLPCLAENYIEVVGYGGAEKFSSYNNFLNYLRETKTTDIYLDNSYDQLDYFNYLENLIGDGYVERIIQQNDNYIFALTENPTETTIRQQQLNQYYNEIYDGYYIVEGDWYSDGWLGKKVVLEFENEIEKKVIFSFSSVDENSHETIKISVGEDVYEVKLNGIETQQIDLNIPVNIGEIVIEASSTRKPENGDLRDLSVIFEIKMDRRN